jgi:hypothetical protein
MVITLFAPAQKVGRASKTPGSVLKRHNLYKWLSFRSAATAVKRIPFGAPVFTAFADMNRPKAKHHAESKLLLVTGDDVPLSYCPSYD